MKRSLLTLTRWSFIKKTSAGLAGGEQSWEKPGGIGRELVVYIRRIEK